jgi:transposase
MSMHPHSCISIPEETILVARAAFPHGNLYLTMRDQLGTVYTDEHFVSLFPKRGRPAEAPWQLALVCVFQFIEGLSDRQAAEAVRSRIDWKYALSLDLADPGFDFSVLSKFRSRLLAGSAEMVLLETMLERFKEQGLLKARGKQRTDSTHVLASIRALNRLECVGEMLRAALNVLACIAPEWLREHADPEWFDRYSTPIEDYRLPKGREAREAYAELIGADGSRLLSALYDPAAPPHLRQLPAVQTLRQTWVFQYYPVEGHLRWRKAEDLPPTGLRFDSPYDPEAHFGNKRSTTWTGYKVHLTETCEDEQIHLITHVETTAAGILDSQAVTAIQEALAKRTLLPSEHFLDSGYVDADVLVKSQRHLDLEIIGPMRPDSSWQTKAGQGYDLSHFTIDWQKHQVTCPQGKLNTCWIEHLDSGGNPVISAKFSATDCRGCPARPLCTKSAAATRNLTFRAKTDHEILQRLRQVQTTPEWKARYDRRAGIEGTISQGTRGFGLRQSRYIGETKTHLQHILTAGAINLVRYAAWMAGVPHAKTRTSRFAALKTTDVSMAI